MSQDLMYPLEKIMALAGEETGKAKAIDEATATRSTPETGLP
jgi:hypothetical protein